MTAATGDLNVIPARFENCAAFFVAGPALWITVALTLALGIGANAAIFSVVRAVLLRPLANRDEDRLLYSAPERAGHRRWPTRRSPFPKFRTSAHSLKTIQELGTFSEIDFTIVGLGTPREIPAGVVDGNYFEVMGLRPVLGRLLTPADDGPNAAGAVVLTYKFWRDSLHSDPNVLGKDGAPRELQRARAPRSSSACWSRRFPTPWQPRSSPTS